VEHQPWATVPAPRHEAAGGALQAMPPQRTQHSWVRQKGGLVRTKWKPSITTFVLQHMVWSPAMTSHGCDADGSMRSMWCHTLPWAMGQESCSTPVATTPHLFGTRH
jgi:hypothetical protein